MNERIRETEGLCVCVCKREREKGEREEEVFSGELKRE